ncbi:MAG: PSD1 and planctomycete cytochrome C domain-containing protein [Pirellulaceae bacterium]
MSSRRVCGACWISLVIAGGLAADEPLPADQRTYFETRIEPVLRRHCYECHSAGALRDGKLKAGLLLDSRDGVRKGGESGAAISAEDSDGSLLISALRYEGLEMPPAGKLPDDIITDFVRWVEMGAPDPRTASASVTETLRQRAQAHWAFVPPQQVAPPEVRQSDWARNEVDRFILARLEQEGLRPSPPADRVTLLRRLSLDLIGLPPTVAEVDAFVADTAPDAYERQVERLLRSPHYGERWGRHWLDAARYADSDGYEKDKPRHVWMYRDWVVAALNRDLPYDQFIIEQIAGDLLPEATQDQYVATGFLRNSMINEEGGVDPEQFRMDAMFDRMDAIGKSILGLAINCCQCHDHKYDPLTQEDYYRMFAFLNDTHEAHIATYNPEEQAQRQAILTEIREIERQLQQRMPDWRQRLVAWEKDASQHRTEWQILKVENAGDNSQRYIYHPDGSQTAWGYAPTKWTSQFRGRPEPSRITAVRLELLTDPNLPLQGPGRSPLGLCALSELVMEVTDGKEPGKKGKVKFASASADFANDEQPLAPMFADKTDKKRVTGPASMAIDGRDETAWGIDAGPGRRNVPRQAVFVLEQPLEIQPGSELTFSLRQMHGGWNSDDNQNNNLGRFRFSLTAAPHAQADPVPPELRRVMETAAEARTAEQWNQLFGYWRTTVPDWKPENERIEQLWARHPVGDSQLVLLAREQSRRTHVLRRGDFLKPGREVEPGVPVVLHPLADESRADRLTFARWLVDPRAPTTARAQVNRVWQAYFGQGFVASSEDLGVQSEPPSHSELFDWLSVEFMKGGWSWKSLHRLIVTSATYRQSSRVSPELATRDPQNRLLARAPRLRVEGEVVRDISLAASGLLNREIGGPSVYPPAPDFLFVPPASYGPKVWREDTGEDRYRRALYTFRFRSVPYPVLTAFDTPNGDASCVRRVRSNTPLQALTTLNEPLFVECARALAQRTLREGGDGDVQRMVYAVRQCVARRPSDRELDVLLTLLREQLERYAAPEARPWELAATDPAHPPELPRGATPAQVAAWTAVARVLLNLDETITKE